MLPKQLFVLLIMCFAFHKIQSADRYLYFEDVSIEFVNESYIDINTFDVSIVYKPNSQNSLSVTLDLLEDAPPDFSVKVAILTRAFGQEIRTGLSFDSNLCEGRAARVFFEEILEPVGMKDCPPKKGSYGNEDYQPNLRRIPASLIPGNNVLLDMELHSSEISILKAKLLMSF